MKTRTIATTLFTFLAFTTYTLTANSVNHNLSVSQECGNTASLRCHGTTQGPTLNDAAQLDEWFGNRDSWEQAGEAEITENTLLVSVTLGEWVNEMESWEQLAEVTANESASSVSVILEEWVNGMESWEQLAEVQSNESAYSGSVILDQWITGMESWEKE